MNEGLAEEMAGADLVGEIQPWRRAGCNRLLEELAGGKEGSLDGVRDDVGLNKS